MKKILLSILIITIVTVVFFILYYPTARQNPDVIYHSLITYSDVTYKEVDGKGLKLDILMPTKDVYDTVPYIVYVHDGDFSNGDKTNMFDEVNHDIAFDILNSGYALISINYRLFNLNTHFPSNLIDVKDALRFLNKNAVLYDLDVTNVGIWGTGTGAFLALNAAYTPSGFYGGELSLSSYSAAVNYVISLNGLTRINDFNVTTMNGQELSDIQRRLNLLFGNVYDVTDLSEADLEEIGIYNPISLVSTDTVPTLIIHGDADDDFPIINSVKLKEKLDEYSAYTEYVYVTIPGGTHDLANDINDAVLNMVRTPILQFIDDQRIE